MWVETKKLLGNLSLPVAIASFLHVCFVYDLKYNKVKLISLISILMGLLFYMSQLGSNSLDILIQTYFGPGFSDTG